MNTAIIVAAGSGTRFNSETPKQFINILGKPLIVHTLESFDAAATIDNVVLVLASDRIDQFKSIHSRFPIAKLSSVVAGGTTRAESVMKGLNAVGEATKIVAVHDGARPLIAASEIDATVRMAIKTGAACLVCEITDTIKSLNGFEIGSTLDRGKLRRALTPQVFRKQLLMKAFEGIKLTDAVTDECSLVEKLGLQIAIVEGSRRNIKITTREDLIFAEAILNSDFADERAPAKH